MSYTKSVVKTECYSCGGTGLYRGMCEGPGTAVICTDCNGTGCREISYVPYTRRRVCQGVDTVRRSAGKLLVTGVGGVGATMTYRDFLNLVPEAKV